LLGNYKAWEWVPEVFERALKQVQILGKQTEAAEKTPMEPAEPVNPPPLWGTSIAITCLQVGQDGGYKTPLQVHTSIIFYQDALSFLRCGFYDDLNYFEAIVPGRICRAKVETPLATLALLEDGYDAFSHWGRISTVRRHISSSCWL
jgi:hypothetical protein